MDGHNSHNFVELIDCAKENNIILVELPEHTSHHLQPLDKSVFGPLKKVYNAECSKLMSENPGIVVSRNNFCMLLSRAWKLAVSAKNMQSGFRSCGIYPFNPSILPEEAFQPNAVTSFVDSLCEEGLEDVSQNKTDSAASNMDNRPVLAPVSNDTTNDVCLVNQSTNVNSTAVMSQEHQGNQEVVDAPLDTVTLSLDSRQTFQSCPADLALLAVELLVGPEVVAQYRQWRETNPNEDYDDQWYKSWKLYNDQISLLSSVAEVDSSSVMSAAVETGQPSLPITSVPEDTGNDVLACQVILQRMCNLSF